MSSDSPKNACVLARPRAAAWQAGAVIYLGVALTGLAAGFWPGAIFHPQSLQGAPLPALASLAVAQAAFFLLAYPLILARRGAQGRFWSACALESVVLLAATAPLYAAAAWVSDAALADCLRAALAVACLCPLGWSAGRALGAGRWTSAVLICLVVAAVGLPWAQYVCRDFAAADRAADVLWQLAPATFVWDAAAPRQPVWWPQPAWSALVWLALAAGLGAVPTRGERGVAPFQPSAEAVGKRQ
jgi:hypothetical protein